MVKLVSAKCPNCGASLNISKEEEKIKCEYCHKTIIVDDAIACYKLKVSGNVSVEGITTNTELIESANDLLNMNEYLKAKRKFKEFSEKCPDDYQGWLGLLICRTRNFTIRDNNILFENDINKYRAHFLEKAPEIIKNQYFETIDRYFDPEKYRKMEEQERIEKKKKELEEKRKIEEEKKRKKENLSQSKKVEKTDNYKDKKEKNSLSEIGVFFLYILGFIIILGGLFGDYQSGETLLYLLLGVSMFKCVYTFFKNRYNISNKLLLFVRIVLPIIIFIIISCAYPPQTENNDNNNDNTIESIP